MVGLRKIDKLGDKNNMLTDYYRTSLQVSIGFITFIVCERSSVDMSIAEEAVLLQCERL